MNLIELMMQPTCRWCGFDLTEPSEDANHCPESPDEGPCQTLLTEGDVEWVIHDRCRGDGSLGGYPGVYTADDFAEDPDFYEDYMNHTRPCEDCGGTGKVRELTVEARERPEVQEYLRDWYETESIYRMERAMGA